MNKENSYNYDDEVDLRELFLAIWDRKILIAFVTSLVAIASVLYALSLPNVYSSNALLASASPEDSLSSKLGGFSSLAGMAGVSIPSASGGKTTEAIERIKSFDFFVNQFLPNIDYKNLVAVQKWKRDTNTIIYNDDIFDLSIEKPSHQGAYIIYNGALKISQDTKTQFVSIGIDHLSPYIAEKWLKVIIQNINDYMRELDKTIAQNSIDFLNSSAQKTNLTEIKIVISKLIENQIQILTLAEATKDYVFKPLSSPFAPEKKSSPSRSRISVMGTILGFMFSILISLLLNYFKTKKLRDAS